MLLCPIVGAFSRHDLIYDSYVRRRLTIAQASMVRTGGSWQTQNL